MRGGVNQEELDYRPRGVRVVEIWKHVWAGDGKKLSPGCARSTRPSQTAPREGLGFHTVLGGVGPGELDFRPRCGEILKLLGICIGNGFICN